MRIQRPSRPTHPSPPLRRRLGRRLLFGGIGFFACALTLSAAEGGLRLRHGGAALVFLPDAPAAQAGSLGARARRFGARSGQVEVTLAWHTMDDIDLHAVEPDGSHIYFAQKHSRGGGELDVDTNVRPATRQPLEHIRWPSRPPMAPGEYALYVHHFKRHERRQVEFEVEVQAGGRVIRRLKATATQGEPPQEVIKFNVDRAGKVEISPSGPSGS